MPTDKKTSPEPVSRRNLLVAGGGAAAMAATGTAGAAAHAGANSKGPFRMTPSSVMQMPKDKRLDLDDPETNFNAMLKLRADTSGKDCLFAFPGETWAMVPQEKNYRCFKTFGIGATRIEEVDEGWRIYSREVLYYLDPDSGEILETWKNPFLGGREVEVMHIANDPVNGVFKRQGGHPVLTPPFPYVSYGDDVVFQWNFYIFKPAELKRAEYPLYSSGDIDQHAELWGIKGRKSEILDPSITSASCVMSWSRVAAWLPFMEMGSRPGTITFHSHSMKLMNGADDLPRYIRDYTEKHYPKYLEAPKEWQGPVMTSAAGEFKKKLDARKE
ncbi:MAG: DUF1838 family protein [Gammaproteobacteria bacterium]|nr:DUF1838 family protein [Gammaproteobacteria bacterium]